MKKSHDEVTVGIFVIVGFVILMLILFFISGVYLFKSGYKVSVMYDYVSILDKGAPVRMAGVRVGEVSAVDLVFDENLQKRRVQVKLFIEKGVEIRENYLFKIQGTHILSEPHIEISPQPGEGALIVGDEVLEGVDPVAVENLIERAEGIATNLDDMLSSLKEAFYNEDNSNAIEAIVVNLAKITESLSIVLEGSEDDLKSVINNIEASSESLKQLMDRIEKGDGTIEKLFTEDELYQEIREFVAEIKAKPWRLMKKDSGGKKFLLF